MTAALRDNRSLACCMPVKDPGPEFEETLRSFQACSPKPFLVVIDDGSAEPLTVDFDRLGLSGLIHRFERNVGITDALNKAFQIAFDMGFKVIARMDGDDLNRPDRFQRQLAYLEAHPECLAVFGSADLIDDAGAPSGTWTPPCHRERLERAMALNNVLIHPTAALRREYIERFGLYSTDYPFAEDYEYFMRGVVGGVVHVMDDRLIDYRVRQGSISFSRYREQLVSRLRVQGRYLRYFGVRGVIGVARTLVLLAGGMVVPPGALGALRRGWLRFS